MHQSSLLGRASHERVLSTFLVGGLLVGSLVGCGGDDSSGNGGTSGSTATPVQAAGSAWLVDVTAEAGVSFSHDPGMRGEYLFPEITGSGCGFIDIDNDGWLDVYWVQCGRALDEPRANAVPNLLYRNRGDGTFTDITAESGAGDTGYGQGMAVGDYNNDGYADLYLSNLDDDVLLRNNGDGTFTDVTREAGIDNASWSIAAGFLDFDRDDDLDLYVSNYVNWTLEGDRDCHYYGTSREDYCGPKTYEPARDVFYRNNGDGTFTDITSDVELDQAFGPGMSVICADFDDDGYVDVYVANDSFPNQLWRNVEGTRFEDVALQWGVAVNGMGQAEGSMGCNAEDFNLDGRLDLFLCHFFEETHTLYLQQGGGGFVDASMPTGLARLSLNRTGFGATAIHLFNDPELYIYAGNGGVRDPSGAAPDPQQPKAEYDQLFRWDRTASKFSDVSDRAGPVMKHAAVSRGVAAGDFDNDGDPDLLVSVSNGPGRLLRNDAPGKQHWLQVHCRGAKGMRDALGAKVHVTIGETTYRRDVTLNYSYGCAADPRVHFGLGRAASADRVEVHWPNGTTTRLENVPADQVLEVAPESSK